MAYILILTLCITLVAALLAAGFVMSATGSKTLNAFHRLLHRNTAVVVSAGFLMVLVFIGLMAFASIRSIRQYRQNAHSVESSNDTIASINELRIDSANGSSIERGTLITNNPAYREAFEVYRRQYVQDAAKLEKLSAGNQSQLARAKQVNNLMTQRFAGWEAAIQNRQDGFNLDTVSSEINDNLANSVRLRDLFVSMESSEKSLLTNRSRQLNTSTNQTLLTLVVSTGLSAVLALIIFAVIVVERRSIMRAKTQSEKLQEQQEDLVAQMKRQTKNIAAQRVRDRAMLQSLGEGFIATDEYGYIISVNPAALEMLGYSQRELVGKWYIKAVTAKHEDGSLVEPIDRPMTQAVSTGKPVAKVINFSCKDGTEFPAFVTVSPVILRGKPVGAVEVFRDITRDRDLDKAKDEFVSLASHQLRTPAAGVKAFASMLLDGYGGMVTPKQREFLQQIYDSNERQLRIVEDLLSVARVDSGRMTLSRSEVNISELVDQVVNEMAIPISGKNQQLIVKTPEKPVVIEADGEKLKMVVDNLISNASKYTPNGGAITVEVEVVRSKLNITVTDTGVGISKEELPGLFKKFSRIENELSAEVGGTGLGLYLAERIVRLHGGNIGVSSQPGKGSRFTLKLPLSRELLYRQSKGAKPHESPSAS